MKKRQKNNIMASSSVQKRNLVLLLSPLLVMAVALPVIYLTDIGGQGDDRSEEIMTHLVRSLHNVHTKREVAEKHLLEQLTTKILQQFPWVRQNNSLSNYFLHGGDTNTMPHHYVNGAVAFLHQHRSAGTTFKECINNISSTYGNLKMAPFDSQRRFNLDNSKKSVNHDRIKFTMGQFSFGLCEKYQQTCSYFTIFRDPLERAISSFEYCKAAMGDEMCGVLNANKVSLRDWILHHGSLLFRQLVFNSDMCNKDSDIDFKKLKETGTVSVENLPCWYKHKLQMDRLSALDEQNLLKYVVNNLEHWFGVIGMFEDIPSTVGMLEEVFKLPFSHCVGQVSSSANTPSAISNNAVQKDIRGDPGIHDNIANHVPHPHHELEEDMQYFQYDYFVKKALEADYRIYNKAKKIFNIQKQTLFNEIVHN